MKNNSNSTEQTEWWKQNRETVFEKLLRLADADPLVLNPPTPEEMRESVGRAKVACHLLIQSIEHGPELTKAERGLLESLLPQGIVAYDGLLRTPPELPWSEIAAFPEDKLEKSRITDRIDDLVGVFCMHEQVDRLMHDVDEFFADGKPFTHSRCEAMMAARLFYPECKTRWQVMQKFKGEPANAVVAI